jgi:hypothetical protein
MNNDKYNTEFLCTYMFYDLNLAKINPLSKKYMDCKKEQVVLRNYESDSDEEDITNDQDSADYLYRNELLNAFNLTEYNDIILNTKINELYKFLFLDDTHLDTNLDTHIDKLKLIVSDLSEKYFNSMEAGFMMLFSYELFHITHNILFNIFYNKNDEELWNAYKLVLYSVFETKV